MFINSSIYYFFLFVLFFFTANNIYSTTYPVGPGRQYEKPSEVMNLVGNGDTVLIDAGIYNGDVGVWRANNLLIRGVGGMAHLQADGAYAQGKGIWVIKGNNTTIENIEFSGVKVPDKNGAGIRQEGAGLIVRHCFVHDNENGILAGDNPESDITIEFSEFARNGYGDGFTHNMYINHIRKFTIRFSYIHEARVGHNVKSRAFENHILYNYITDAETGNSSMLIDLPNGGLSFIIGNILVQGPQAENRKLISYGAEGLSNPDKRVYTVNNTMLNYRHTGTFLYLREGTEEARVVNNIFAGTGAGSDMCVDGQAEELSNLHNNDIMYIKFRSPGAHEFDLLEGSPAIDSGIDPGHVGEMNLVPVCEYKHPADSLPRNKSGIGFDIGAYEYSPPSFVDDHISTNDDCHVYPLPVKTRAYIPAGLEFGFCDFEIYNQTGNLIRKGPRSIISGYVKFDRANLVSGLYYYIVSKKTEILNSGHLIID